ncbi:MAG: zinc metallopeptidase [Oscillospiraceae bacterium]|jgi:Zn-dependent membrane protease YugP|nr:zinc metallopeptidase [Oscillospiraceae bacterium]
MPLFLPYGGYSYFDQYFFLLIIPAMVFSLAMQIMVKSAYRKNTRVLNSRGVSGAAAAAQVLRANGVEGVHIVPVRGVMSDHFDPRSNTIRLSEGVYASTSVAAVGIAAHEAGHAVQHARRYTPIRVRNAILPVCNIGSTLGFPLVLVGFAVGIFEMVTLGLILFSLVTVFQLITLPVEFNASRRALAAIERQDLLSDAEYKGARAVLRAAAMTYVAALVVSLANLLRILLRFRRRD